MRDHLYIEEFCAELARLWHKHPDLRFGQMFSNVCSTFDPFYIEDDKMLKMFKRYFNEEQGVIMSRKQKKYVITSEEMFDFQKPKFNGFACGYGVHKDKSKYNRKQKHRKDWSEE